MSPLSTVLFFLLVALLNISCSSPPKVQGTQQPAMGKWSDIPGPIPRAEPLSKYGNPPFYKVKGQRYYTRTSSRGYQERGIASWYGTKFHGRRTSSGEIYDMHGMTAAHRSLPLPSYVMVTNLKNKRRVIVRVNDRGPFHSDRIIDLSYVAALKLGLVQRGTGFVEVRAVVPRTAVAPPPGEQELVGSEKELYLQVGAFENRRRAEQLQKRLQSLVGTVTKVNLTPHPQASFYRVRIGPLPSVEKLDNLSRRLAELGFSDPIVVR